MTDRARLQALSLIARLQRDQALHPVARLLADRARLEAARRALQARLAGFAADPSDPGAAARAAAHVGRLRGMLMDTTPDLARVAADLDAAKHRAARAVARADILARLEKRLDGRAASPGR